MECGRIFRSKTRAGGQLDIRDRCSKIGPCSSGTEVEVPFPHRTPRAGWKSVGRINEVVCAPSCTIVCAISFETIKRFCMEIQCDNVLISEAVYCANRPTLLIGIPHGDCEECFGTRQVSINESLNCGYEKLIKVC